MGDKYALAYKSIDELTARTRTSSDYVPFWDVSEADWSKALATEGTFTAATVTSLGGDGDANTLITFTDDAINITAGGVSFVDFTETVQDILTLNPGATDIDFVLNKLTSGTAISYDSGTDALTIGAATLAMTATTTFAAINRYKATNAITAFAGGGQGSAVALASEINSITVCATAGDSVKLPASVVGMRITVGNLGAAYANVFPSSGDLIDALAANAAVSLPTGSSLTFTCTVAGTWKSSPVAIPSGKFNTGTTTVTFTAGQLTGAAHTVYHNTGSTPGSIATRTATQMFADDPTARVGYSYICEIVNAQGTGTLTVTAGVGVTLTGTATIAVNTSRLFVVTYTSATALVMQNLTTTVFS